MWVRLDDDVQGTWISFSTGTFANPSKPFVSNCMSRFSMERELYDLCTIASTRRYEIAQCAKCPPVLMMSEIKTTK